MIDTHAHIKPSEQLRVDSLQLVILSASNLEDSEDNIELAKKYPIFRPSVGIHPQEEISDVRSQISEIEELLKQHTNIIAVGETGLDFSREHSPLQQEELFRGQIELAQKYNKPLIVHSRKAMEETINILNSYKNLRGVVHCYSGGKKRIKEIMALHGEWYFGIDGNLTYEPGLQEVVRMIPKDRLLLETDSPELTPVPFRGEKNYPEYVRYVYEKVAEIWGMGFEETEKIVDENAVRLFGL